MSSLHMNVWKGQEAAGCSIAEEQPPSPRRVVCGGGVACPRGWNPSEALGLSSAPTAPFLSLLWFFCPAQEMCRGD